MLARDAWSCWSVVQDIHRTRQIKANRCLSQLHECLGHKNLGGFSFVGGTFHGMNMSLDEAIALGILQA